jgi:hypothetical protein
MAERPHPYERRWARTALVAVGFLAISACNAKAGSVGYTNPHELTGSGYINFGQLNCDWPTPNTLSDQYDFSDRAVRAIVVSAVRQPGQVPDSMYIKLLGPNSSVLATKQGSTAIDVNQGTLETTPVVVDKVLPGVRITVTPHADKPEVVDMLAECD